MDISKNKDDIEKKLIKLGARRLARTLIELAQKFEEAEDRINRMIASGDELEALLKKKFKSIRSIRRMHFGREVGYLASQLESILEDIREGVTHSEEGIKWMTRFFRLDKAVFEHADDSSGQLGDVFRLGATDLFIQYARQFHDKGKLIKIIHELLDKNEYGVVDVLLKKLNEFLDENHIKLLVERLLTEERKFRNEMKKYIRERTIADIAYQVGAPEYYIEIIEKFPDSMMEEDYIRIARLYLNKEHPKKALEYLNKVTSDFFRNKNEFDKLLMEVYQQLGMKQELQQLVLKKFEAKPTEENFEVLKMHLGEEESAKLLQQEVQHRIQTDTYSLSDLVFFQQFKLWDECDRYIRKHHDTIDGEMYGYLVPLAQELETQSRYLAATILYRRLMEGILNRSYYKGYGAAVRHLKKLDSLAPKITDWGSITPHEAYFQAIREKHKRKTAFWRKYGEIRL